MLNARRWFEGLSQLAAIEISFPGQSVAGAGKLAQDVRAAVIKAGVPSDQANLRRERDDTQDLGTILSVETVSLVVNVASLAVAIYEIGFRNRSVMRIKTTKGEIEIGPGTMEVDHLKAILSESFVGDSKPKP